MKSYRIVSLFLLLSLLLWTVSCATPPVTDTENNLSQSSTPDSAATVSSVYNARREVRGVWIASVYNINFPSAPDLADDALMAELDSIVDTCVENGLNTLYFQTHPSADALYASENFPVSPFLFTDGILHFDPLLYLSQKCADSGIELFAWVNPLRVSTGAYDTKEMAVAALPEGSPGADSDLTVFYGDGKLYFNCGVPAVRELIAEEVAHIAESYDVAGVVFDDYFYPYPVYGEGGALVVFDDGNAYSPYSSVSLAEWRRSNVNSLIKMCYDSLKQVDESLTFGVAPFGIWQNDDGDGVGSATSGMEAYHTLYCDAVAWIKGGYVDFISPQLYWEIGNSSGDFEALMSFWNGVVEGTGVDLIISHALYRYDGEWDDPSGEIVRQVSSARERLSYKGSVMYGYAALRDNVMGAADDTALAFSEEIYYYTPASVASSPVLTDSTIDGMTVKLCGISDPMLPLTVNGVTVQRSHGGHFECTLVLAYGENRFRFSSGDQVNEIVVVKR